MKTVYPFLIFLFSLILLTSLAILLWWRYRNQVVCGDDVNPNDKYCNANSQPTIGSCPESTCNPITKEALITNLGKFIDYIEKIQSSSSSLTLSLSSSPTPSPSWNPFTPLFQEWGDTLLLYPGVFYFAIPELLNVLPSDFGQNYTTPYGLISFFDRYLDCISKVQEFCDSVFHGEKGLSIVCQTYLEERKKTRPSCIFPIHDNSRQLYIEDSGFFNQIGLLGSISLTPQQAIVLFVDLPVADLALNYWSFNLYLSDNLDPGMQCYPFRQTVVASIAPSFNLYTAVAASGKKFNPLTGEGDLLKKGHVQFYLIFCMDQQIADSLSKTLNDPQKCDLVHVFKIPTGEGSLPLTSDLPNPNQFAPPSPLFDPTKQRITIFLRLSPNQSTYSNPVTLESFIRDTSSQYFKVCLTDFKNVPVFNQNPPLLYDSLHLPPMIQPRFNEVLYKGKEMEAIHKNINWNLFWNLYGMQQLRTFNSLLQIMAPLYQKLLFSNKPYQGGFQAIQLAGNAQGDNFDAQYRTGQPACLGNQDVMIGLALNHARYNNCVYNNMNVTDRNKAFGAGSINMDKSVPFDYYVVLTGRNRQLLNQTEHLLTNVLETNHPEIRFQCFTIFLPDGPNIEQKIPSCHLVSMLERVYLNTRFLSVQDASTTFDLQSLFGDDLMGLLTDAPAPAWESLTNICAPMNDKLVPPVFIKAFYQPHLLRNGALILLIVFLLAFLTVVLMMIFTRKPQKPS